MTDHSYMPTGRTSTVKKGATLLQVQTEYATRPSPRITTTILDNGRVLHKIERSLEQPVRSQDEQQRAETTLLRQHAEVIAIIQGDHATVPLQPKVIEIVEEKILGSIKGDLSERLSRIPGVQTVFRLENDGTFAGENTSEEFKRLFAPVLKNLRELMELFERLPGVGITRQQGVYEVERDRLYFVSAGDECFFVVVRRVNVTTQYEQEIRAILRSVQVTS